MFLKFQKHQAWNIFQQYIYMSAVHLCTIKYYVKIIYIIISLKSDINVCYYNIELNSFCNSVSRLLVGTVCISCHWIIFIYLVFRVLDWKSEDDWFKSCRKWQTFAIVISTRQCPEFSCTILLTYWGGRQLLIA